MPNQANTESQIPQIPQTLHINPIPYAKPHYPPPTYGFTATQLPTLDTLNAILANISLLKFPTNTSTSSFDHPISLVNNAIDSASSPANTHSFHILPSSFICGCSGHIPIGSLPNVSTTPINPAPVSSVGKLCVMMRPNCLYPPVRRSRYSFPTSPGGANGTVVSVISIIPPGRSAVMHCSRSAGQSLIDLLRLRA